MQKRIFGTENEYSFAVKNIDNKEYYSFPAPSFLFSALRRYEDYDSLRPYRLLGGSSYTNLDRNFWLGSNGAKFYFDNDLPEYSAPECDSVKLCVAHEKAGERFLNDLRAAALEGAENLSGPLKDVVISKNTTSFAEASRATKYVGSHENYFTHLAFHGLRVGRSQEQKDPVSDNFNAFLIPFLLSRVILHGAGGIRRNGTRGWHYVISQKAFAMEKVLGSKTVEQRPLIHFRQKNTPPDFARMHLIYGDANMSSVSLFLKMGTTHLVLRVFEENENVEPLFVIEDPLVTICRFSGDLTLGDRARDELTGQYFNAIQIQREFIDYVLRKLRSFSEEENKILELWQKVVETLERSPEELCRLLDWVIKRHYLQKITDDFSQDKAQLFDFLYSDVSENGFYNRFCQKGLVDELVSEADINRARFNPPPTRAAVRSRYIKEVLKKHIWPWSVDWHYIHNISQFELINPYSCENEELNKFIESL